MGVRRPFRSHLNWHDTQSHINIPCASGPTVSSAKYAFAQRNNPTVGVATPIQQPNATRVIGRLDAATTSTSSHQSAACRNCIRAFFCDSKKHCPLIHALQAASLRRKRAGPTQNETRSHVLDLTAAIRQNPLPAASSVRPLVPDLSITWCTLSWRCLRASWPSSRRCPVCAGCHGDAWLSGSGCPLEAQQDVLAGRRVSEP